MELVGRRQADQAAMIQSRTVRAATPGVSLSMPKMKDVIA